MSHIFTIFLFPPTIVEAAIFLLSGEKVTLPPNPNLYVSVFGFSKLFSTINSFEVPSCETLARYFEFGEKCKPQIILLWLSIVLGDLFSCVLIILIKSSSSIEYATYFPSGEISIHVIIFPDSILEKWYSCSFFNDWASQISTPPHEFTPFS